MRQLPQLREGWPLPLAPASARRVGLNIDVIEDGDGGVVLLAGVPAWYWSEGDVAGRRLAAVQALTTGAAQPSELAEGFGVRADTLTRWRTAYERGGVEALCERPKGPQGPSKLTTEKVTEIETLRARGLSVAAIAERVGVGTNSVSRALRGQRRGAAPIPVVREEKELVALARPLPRIEERQLAWAGMLEEASVVITEGASLPMAGVLTILPALAVTGLLEAGEAVYGRARAAFYGLRSLLLTVALAALLGQPRAEGLTRMDPADLGRLIGLDRAPEVKTLRRRIEELAGEGRAEALIGELARHHVAAHASACAVLYVDGHVRAYHGGADLPKAHLARMRLAMPATIDTWVADAHGDGVLVWSTPPDESLAGELRRVATEVRALVGPERRPTIVFDRGGWSPRLFAELEAQGFDILTYRKAPLVAEPARAFAVHRFTDEAGRVHEYELAERRVRIPYEDGRRRWGCRQITRRSENGHQTPILTTRAEPDLALLAHLMFSRWRQENFFKYMRAHFALDGLDSYATVPDDLTRLVANPAKKTASRQIAGVRRAMASSDTDFGQRAVTEVPGPELTAHRALQGAADRYLTHLKAERAALPLKVPLGEVRPEARRHHGERKRIFDAIRLAAYNAESAVARLLAPHYARAEDEARTLLREVFASPADLQVVGGELHVRIAPLSAPRRTRALAALCADLNATQTRYPGTDLILVYSSKNA